MHDQSEFQSDPFQDRPAEKGLQEWVELEAWPFEALPELGTTASSRFEGDVVHGSAPGGGGQPSYTVRTVLPQKGLETRRKYTRIQIYEIYYSYSYCQNEVIPRKKKV